MDAVAVPVLYVTGPVGVGKSTVATEAGALLERVGVPHAVVDYDAIACSFPRPADDGFNFRIAHKNLAALWANYHAAGATHLIVAGVLESRAELDALREAVPGSEITVVRLRAPKDTLTSRVAGRELGAGRGWHLDRAVELADQMDRDRVEDFAVETDGRSVTDIAREVLQCAGWL